MKKNIWRSPMKTRKRKAFTLIELIVVIGILALLAAIAIPRYTASKTKAAITAHNTNVQVLRSAATMAIADGELNFTWKGTGKTDTGDSDGSEKYIAKFPTVPKGLKDTTKETYEVTCVDGDINISPEEILDTESKSE